MYTKSFSKPVHFQSASALKTGQRNIRTHVASPNSNFNVRVAGVQSPPASAPTASVSPPVYVPEDYVLQPGELSTIKRDAPLKPTDVFRCSGCTKPECQGPKGCAPTAWRLDPSG